MAIGYCPTPKETMYQNVDYAKPEVIQGLIRFYEDFKAVAQKDMNCELIAIYLDLQRAFSEVILPSRQKEALDYYMEGWTEETIGEKMGGISHQASHKLILKACKKISDYLTKGDKTNG